MATTVGILKEQIHAYLHQDAKTDLETVLTDVDIALFALNNARKKAELLHNFSTAQVRATGSISTTTGLSLDSITTDQPSAATVNLKAIETVYFVLDSTGLQPIRMRTKTSLAKRGKELAVKNFIAKDDRYPASLAASVAAAQPNSDTICYRHGRYIYLDPVPSAAVSVKIDGYRWLADYTTDSDTDFITDKGSRYMLLQGILECNLYVRSLMPRTEGTLNPPSAKEIDDALRELVSADIQQSEFGIDWRFR